MSWVTLLAADHPVPFYRAPEQRTRFVRFQGKQMTVREDGFSVAEHSYYRGAVDELGYSMKPHQYELNLRATEDDLRQLRDYLTRYFTPGEEVELWSLWVGGGEKRLERYRGPWQALDMEALNWVEKTHPLCLTIEL